MTRFAFLMLLAGGVNALLAGGLPTGYTRLEYIESTDAEQFIDTKHCPGPNTRVKADFQLTTLQPLSNQNYNVIFSAGEQWTVGTNIVNAYFGFFQDGRPSPNELRWWLQYNSSSGPVPGTPDTARHTIEIHRGLQFFDGAPLACRDELNVTLNYSLYIFCQHTSWLKDKRQGPARMRLYSFQMWEGDRLVRDLTPCKRNADNSVGVYDSVYGQFYFNANPDNATPFSAGPEISTDWWEEEPSISRLSWSAHDALPPRLNRGSTHNGASVDCNYTEAQLAALPAGEYTVTFRAGDLVKSIPVRVDDVFRMTLAADGATADFTFPSAPVERTLLVAFGTTDGGEDRTAWDHVAEVATVPTNTTQLTGVVLPDGVRAASIVRALLSVTAPTARSYVRGSHLIAQWDGIENAGFGQHDAGRAYPVDLRGGLVPEVTGTLPATDDCFKFGSGYMKFDAPAIIQSINFGHTTVELVLRNGGAGINNNGGYFCAGNGSRAFWTYQQGSAMQGDISYRAAISGNASDYADSMPAVGGWRTYSYVLAECRNDSFVARNGELLGHRGNPNETRLDCYSTFCTDNELYLGFLPNKWSVMAKADVLSIRVYDCLLTREEIAQNVRVDKARFDANASVYIPSAPCYPSVPFTVGKVVKTGSVPTGVTVSFAGSNEPRDLYLVYGAKDAGEQTAGWAAVEHVAVIPSGVVSADVTFPPAAQEFLASKGGFRFLLRPRPTARSYVQDEHLIMQWDGEENAGFGVHDPAAKFPVELRGGVDQEVFNGAFPVEDKAFKMGTAHTSFKAQKFIKAVNAGHTTVEIVLAKDGDNCKHNGGFISIGYGTRTFWIYQQVINNNTLLINTVSSHAPGSAPNFYDIHFSDDGTNTVSFVCETTTWPVDTPWYVNGTQKGIYKNFSADGDPNDMCYLGVLGGGYLPQNYRPFAHVYSVRLYDCALTVDELAENSRIDGLRFRNAFTDCSYSDYVPTLQGLVLTIR